MLHCEGDRNGHCISLISIIPSQILKSCSHKPVSDKMLHYYRQAELDKKKMYDEQISEMERGYFLSFGVFTLWWDGPRCN